MVISSWSIALFLCVSTKEKNPDPIAESVVKPLDNLPIGLWIVGASYSFLLIVVELFFGGREISPRLKQREKKKRRRFFYVQKAIELGLIAKMGAVVWFWGDEIDR